MNKYLAIFLFFILFVIFPSKVFALEGSCKNYPFPQTIPAPKNQIRVMTFNVMFAHFDAETGRDTAAHMKKIAQAIKAENLDVVLLQEMEYVATDGKTKFYCPYVTSSACCIPYNGDTGGVSSTFPYKNAFEYLEKELLAIGYPMFYASGNYVEGNLAPQKTSGWHGYSTTLSKYPIVKTIPHYTTNERVVFRADINIGGKIVSFYNLHIKGTTSMDFVWGLFTNALLPYNSVLVGDFNISEDLAKTFSNSSRDVNYYLNPYTGPTHGMLDAFFVRKPTSTQGLGVSNLAVRGDLMVESSHAPTLFTLDLSKIPLTFNLYDVDQNGTVNLNDVLFVVKSVFNIAVPNYFFDIDYNGTINIADVVKLVGVVF